VIISYQATAQEQNFIYDRVGNFKEGLAPIYEVNSTTKVGYIDNTGKEVIPVTYEDDYKDDAFTNGLAKVKKNGLYGLVDKTGKLIVPCDYRSIGTFSEGIVEAYKPDGKVGFINTKGKMVIPFQYNIFSILGGVKCINGMIPIEGGNGKKGYIDKAGKIIVPLEYEIVRNFSDGLGMVKKIYNGKVSFVNTKGEIVIREKYDNATPFMDGLAYVNIGAKEKTLYDGLSGGKWGVIDKTGKVIVPIVYDMIDEIKNGLTIVAMGKYPNEKKGLINIDGKTILPVEYYDIKILKDRIIVNKVFTGDYAIFTYSGKQICDFNWHYYDIFPDFTEGLLRVQEAKNNVLGKVGAIDANAVLKIPFKYGSIAPFKEGLAIVSINEKYGAIDKTGKIVIPLIYDGLGSFYEGWAIVSQNGKYGFLNKSGKLMKFTKTETATSDVVKKTEPTKETTKTGGNTNPSILLDENFDNNNNNWTFWDNENDAAKIYKGSYRFTVKKSNRNTASWLSFPVLAANQSNDFTIESKFVLYSTETGNPNDSYWLLWGIGENAKYNYAFGIYPEGKCQYGKHVNGAWDGKAGQITSSSINIGVNKANVLRVQKKGNTILFFINGVQVHQAVYETFNSAYSTVGFQLNNKKIVDIEYLKIFKGQENTSVKSPDNQEANYQKAIANAANSTDRANAIIDYYLSVKALNNTDEQQVQLLSQKFLQMMDIDYHGYFQVLISRRIKPDDVKLCLKASEVLSSEQRNAVKLLAKYNVDDYVATEKNTAKPSYPAGVPRPGYGWRKTVSSDKTPNNPNPPVVVKTPMSVDRLAELKASAANLQGTMVYLGNTNYFVPQKITINSLNDEITLVGIGADYTYSYSKGRTVFGITSLNHIKKTIKVDHLINMIYNVSGAYIVTEIGECKKCSGKGGSWNNTTRKGSTCANCSGTGCVPTAIWNNGSSRAFFAY